MNATLRRTDADLEALVNEIPAAALSLQAVPRYERELNAVLDRRLFNAEEISDFRIHDANGEALYLSDKAHARRINISDLDYFQKLRANPGIRLVFSDALICRSSNRPILMVARALRDQQGNFKGVVSGPLKLDYYKEQFQLHEVGTQGFVVLGRSNSQIPVVRWPEVPNESAGAWAPDYPIMDWLAKDDNELTLHLVDRLGHASRIVSIRKQRTILSISPLALVGMRFFGRMVFASFYHWGRCAAIFRSGGYPAFPAGTHACPRGWDIESFGAE